VEGQLLLAMEKSPLAVTLVMVTGLLPELAMSSSS
jgi:hypothetical protein